MNARVPPELEPLLVPITELETLPGNPRKGDISAVAQSYRRFGQTKPIVARHWEDGGSYIIAGNHQFLAARDRLGWDHIAVVWRDDLSEMEAKALALADNSSWPKSHAGS